MRSNVTNIFNLQPRFFCSFINDQEFMNKQLKHEILVYVLPHLSYPNGFTVMQHDTILPSYKMMHFNFIIGHDKKQKMKQYGVWFIDDTK